MEMIDMASTGTTISLCIMLFAIASISDEDERSAERLKPTRKLNLIVVATLSGLLAFIYFPICEAIFKFIRWLEIMTEDTLLLRLFNIG